MQTPIKYALGFLALIAAVTPAASAGYAAHAHGYIFEGGLDSLAGKANLFNACDDADIGTTVTTTAYDVMVNVIGLAENSFPATTVRAGDMDISSSCVYVFPAEQGTTITVVANGCATGAPLYATCALWTKKAESLGVQACFYDGVNFVTPLGCIKTYDFKGDLVGTVPAGSVYMLVKASATSSLISWWMYDGLAGAY